MHARLIVLVDKEHAEDSEGAREYVESKLIANEFAGEGNLFSSPPADWFVIGGRWSGELTWWRLGKEVEDKFYAVAKERDLTRCGGERTEEQCDQQLIALFREIVPDFDGEPPIGRDTYAHRGYEDDAQILDEGFFNRLQVLKSFRDGDLGDGCHYIDLDAPFEKLTENAIGQKWVVIVDFHS